MSSASILYCDMAAEEYLTFHDVLLKIQGQLELLKRIHLQQLSVANKIKVPQLATGRVCNGAASDKNYELQCGTAYSDFNQGSATQVQGDVGNEVFVDPKELKEQIQEQEFQFTESMVTKESDLFFRHNFRSADRELLEGNVGCSQGQTIKMREINSALCNRTHVGTSLVEMGKSSDATMHLERKKLDTGELEMNRIWELQRSGDDDRKEATDNGKLLDKQDQSDKWAVGNENDGREAGNANSFRRRKRKQENEKIHRTICESKISGITSSDEQRTMAGDSPKKVGNGWTRVAPGSPGEMSSKVCSDEELETTSKVKRSSFVGAGYTENKGHDSFRQEEEASGERGSNHRYSSGGSELNKVCDKEPIDVHKSGKEGNSREVRKQVEDELGEFISRELPLKDGAVKGEVWELYRSLLCKIVGLMSEDGENKDGNPTTGLEDALLREQIENEKLRAEVAARKDKFDHVLRLAEEGSRKCTYCQSIREKLCIDLKSDSRIEDACVSLPAEVQTRTFLDSENNLEMDLPKSYGSPMGNCLPDTEEPEKRCAKVEREDDSSMKRKRELKELRFLGKGKGKKSKSFLQSPLLREIGMVPCTGSNADVGSSEDFPSFSPHTEGSMLCKDLDMEKNGLEELPEIVKVNESELPLKVDLKIEDEVGELDFIKDAMVDCDKGFKAVDSQEDPDTIVVEDEHPDGQNLELPIDVEGFFEGLKALTGNGFESKFVELKCGCTSQVYGDTIGILRVEKTGMLEIYCRCSVICEKGNPMTPATFERHAGRGSSRKWKDSIWVVLGDQKIQFSKVQGLDALYRHYKTLNHVKLTQTGNIKQQYHRDEFIKCTKCQKERRFRRRNNEECRLYHDALMNPSWNCSNFPFNRLLSCEDDEEREVRRAIRGCVRVRACQGCIDCVCLGCNMCRFSDCGCRSCDDYLANST
eukprot:c29026_g2_i1 orf=570-3362(-)